MAIPLNAISFHVSDLADAILKALDNPRARQETFNICMDEPVDYQQVAITCDKHEDFLAWRLKLPTIRLAGQYESEISSGWRPRYDLSA